MAEKPKAREGRADRQLVQCILCNKICNKDSMHNSHFPSFHPGVKVQHKKPKETLITGFFQKQNNDALSSKAGLQIAPKPFFAIPKPTGVSKIPVSAGQCKAAGKVKLVEEPQSTNVATEYPNLTNQRLVGVMQDLKRARSYEEAKHILNPVSEDLIKFRKFCQDTKPQGHSPIVHTTLSPRNAKLTTDLKKDFIVMPSAMNGNCFFNSVSTVLFGSECMASSLRLLQLQELLLEQTALEKNSRNIFGKEFSDLYLIASTDKEYATEANMYIMSEILQRPILSVQPHLDGETWDAYYSYVFMSNPRTATKEPLYILFLSDIEHFEPMLPLKYPVTSLTIGDCHNSFTNVTDRYNYFERPKRDKSLQVNESFKKPRLEQSNSSEDIDLVASDDNMEFQSPEKMEEADIEPVLDPVPLSKSKISEQDAGASCSSSTSLSSASKPIFKKIDKGFLEITKLLKESLHINDKPCASSVALTKQILPAGFSKNFQSIKELEDYYTFLDKVYYTDPETTEPFVELRCRSCFDEFDNLHRGRFRYQLSHGDNFCNKTQPPPFYNLKGSLLVHSQSEYHKQATAKQEDDEEQAKLAEERNRDTGRILARLAYTAIKVDHNISKYEDYVALQAAMGTDVGDINHSADFCAGYRHSIYTCLQNKLIEELNTPVPGTLKCTPFAVVADKYTAQRITGQIVGIIAWINGEIRAFAVCTSKLREFGGLATAQNIKESLNLLVEDEKIRTRCVGGCLDGEYFNKNVPEHFLNDCLQIENENWHSFFWDTAHIMERAMTDVEKSRKIKLLNKVSKTVHDINKNFRIGLNYIQAEGIASEEQVRLYAPIQSSSTRFVAHEYTVLRNFAENFLVYRRALGIENQVQNIDHADFVVALNFQLDLLNKLALISAESQKVKKLPWRVDQTVRNGLNEIREMIESLPSSEDEPIDLHEGLSHMKECLPQLQIGEWHNVPITFRPYFTTSLRSQAGREVDTTLGGVLCGLKKEAFDLFAILEHGYLDRLNRFRNPIKQTVENSFQLEKLIEAAESNTPPDDFTTYVAAAKSAGYLEEEIDDKDVLSQYLTMAKLVKQQHDEHMLKSETDPLEVLELRIYSTLINSNVRRGIETAVDLLLSGILRTHAESVVESMGSLVKIASEGRPIDFQNLSEEMVVSFNGPPPLAEGALVLMENAMDHYFRTKTKSGKWNFHRVTKQKSKLLCFVISKVVDKKTKEANEKSKLNFK